MRLTITLLVLAASAIVPAGAYASDVSPLDTTLRYIAAPGEANRVAITLDGDRYVIEDQGARISGCEPLDGAAAHRVACKVDDPSRTRFLLVLGDMDDVAVGSPTLDAIHGGAGTDNLYGGAGEDELYGGEGDDLLDGGGGDGVSRSQTGYAYAGAKLYVDSLDGGPGADTLNGGGGDFDRVVYTSRHAPVSVTLDGLPNDGEAGEGDHVGADVEDAYGGGANDVLVGNGGPNSLVGGDGDDFIDGRGGYQDSALGDDGNDTILLSDGGEEAAHGVQGAVPGVPFDDLVTCDSFVEGAPNGDDTAFVDPTDSLQAGGMAPCEHVVMSYRPQPLPVTPGGTITVPLACGAGPSRKSCDGVATVRLPGVGSAARRAPRPSGRRIAQRRFRMHLGKTRRVKVRLNKPGRRAARGHRRLRVWVTYGYPR